MQDLKDREGNRVYKKFMFNRRFDQSYDDIKHAEEDIADILHTFNEEEQKEIENIITQDSADISELSQEEVYIPPSFSQSQLDEAVAKAKAEGIADGKKEVEDSILQAQKNILQSLEDNIGKIADSVGSHVDEIESDFLAASALIFRKLLPEFEKRGGFEEVRAVLEGIFSDLSREPKLVISVHPSLVDRLKEVLPTLGKKKGFSGKILINGKEEFTLSDIQVEWDKGGLKRDSRELMAGIEKTISLYSGGRIIEQGE